MPNDYPEDDPARLAWEVENADRDDGHSWRAGIADDW
jgi:hypothetical protein